VAVDYYTIEHTVNNGVLWMEFLTYFCFYILAELGVKPSYFSTSISFLFFRGCLWVELHLVIVSSGGQGIDKGIKLNLHHDFTFFGSKWKKNTI
jgi:hypothetical protein